MWLERLKFYIYEFKIFTSSFPVEFRSDKNGAKVISGLIFIYLFVFIFIILLSKFYSYYTFKFFGLIEKFFEGLKFAFYILKVNYL